MKFSGLAILFLSSAALVACSGAEKEQALANTDAVDILEPQLHVIKGSAKNVVPAMAHELAVDLVVMGTVARTGTAGFFMGNTAESVLAQLDCSVLTIKPPGFTSPITLDA